MSKWIQSFSSYVETQCEEKLSVPQNKMSKITYVDINVLLRLNLLREIEI